MFTRNYKCDQALVDTRLHIPSNCPHVWGVHRDVSTNQREKRTRRPTLKLAHRSPTINTCPVMSTISTGSVNDSGRTDRDAQWVLRLLRILHLNAENPPDEGRNASPTRPEARPQSFRRRTVHPYRKRRYEAGDVLWAGERAVQRQVPLLRVLAVAELQGRDDHRGMAEGPAEHQGLRGQVSRSASAAASRSSSRASST